MGINALRASEAAAVRIEDYAESLRGHRVLHLVGKGNKPATMPLTVPVLRVLDACRGERAAGPLVLRPMSGRPIDRRAAYRMVTWIAKAAGIPRHTSPHSLRHAAITNALDAGVPLRDAQILARHADPRTTEHYDRARGNLDRHAVHFLPPTSPASDHCHRRVDSRLTVQSLTNQEREIRTDPSPHPCQTSSLPGRSQTLRSPQIADEVRTKRVWIPCASASSVLRKQADINVELVRGHRSRPSCRQMVGMVVLGIR